MRHRKHIHAPFCDRRRARRRPRRPRAGFTLIELMFSLVIGSIALAALYSVVGGSTRLFHEQHRITRVQNSLHRAVTMLTRDIQRAGYLSTPSATAPGESCDAAGVGAPLVNNAIVNGANFAGIADWREETFVATGLQGSINNLTEPTWGGAAVPGALRRADSITLLANYETNAEYTVNTLLPGNGTASLQPSWHTFATDFTQWSTQNPAAVDMAAVQEAFADGRALRILTKDHRKHFAVITSTIAAGGPGCEFGGGQGFDDPPCVRFTPPVPQGCEAGASGGWIAPLSFMRYRVRPLSLAANPEAPRDVQVTGPNTQLQRVEMDPRNPNTVLMNGAVPASFTAVLDYVAFFNTIFLANTANGAGQNDTVPRATAFDPRTNPERVRSVIFELAARTPTHDPSFAWPGLGADPAQRFLVFDDGRPGAARVRYARAEVFVPNVAMGGF